MSWKDRHVVIPAVYVLLRRGDQVLLMRRYNTGYCDGLYSLPAGHLDGGETATAAIVREAAEEAGVRINPASLRLVHVMHRLAESGDHERMDLYFETTVWHGEPQVVEKDKCDGLLWAALQALPGNMVPVVGVALRHIAAGKLYSEEGF